MPNPKKDFQLVKEYIQNKSGYQCISDESEYECRFSPLKILCSHHGIFISSYAYCMDCNINCPVCKFNLTEEQLKEYNERKIIQLHNEHKKRKEILKRLSRERQIQKLKHLGREPLAKKGSILFKLKKICNNVHKRAKKENVEWSITYKDVIFNEFCPLLGIKLCIDNKISQGNSPSIDRLKNNLGYTPDNILVVSMKANTMKNKLSLYQINLININYNNVCSFEDRNEMYDKEYTRKVKYNESHHCKYINDPIKTLIYKARERKIKYNIPFNMTVDDLFFPKFCPLLGIPIVIGTNCVSDGSPSIDRIDNTKGYVKGNVRIISRIANISKSNSTREEYDLFTRNLNKIFLERNLLTEEEIQQIKSINTYFPNTPPI